MSVRRLKECVENWPDCEEGQYHPSCCRFPKSCSCTIYPEGTADELLETPWTRLQVDPRPRLEERRLRQAERIITDIMETATPSGLGGYWADFGPHTYAEMVEFLGKEPDASA